MAQIIREQEEEQIRLICSIVKTMKYLTEFKLGRARFMPPDPGMLCTGNRQRSSVSYGKQLTFHHSIYAFAEEDRPLCML